MSPVWEKSVKVFLVLPLAWLSLHPRITRILRGILLCWWGSLLFLNAIHPSENCHGAFSECLRFLQKKTISHCLQISKDLKHMYRVCLDVPRLKLFEYFTILARMHVNLLCYSFKCSPHFSVSRLGAGCLWISGGNVGQISKIFSCRRRVLDFSKSPPPQNKNKRRKPDISNNFHARFPYVKIIWI